LWAKSKDYLLARLGTGRGSLQDEGGRKPRILLGEVAERDTPWLEGSLNQAWLDQQLLLGLA